MSVAHKTGMGIGTRSRRGTSLIPCTRGWQAGASLIVWQGIRDETAAYLAGGGLESVSRRPKPQMAAFAFPIVADNHGGHGLVWGRVPAGRPVKVTIEVRSARRWRTVTVVRSNRQGFFAVHLRVTRGRLYRSEPEALDLLLSRSRRHRHRKPRGPGRSIVNLHRRGAHRPTGTHAGHDPGRGAERSARGAAGAAGRTVSRTCLAPLRASSWSRAALR